MNRHEFYDSLNKYKANSLTHYGTLGQKWGVRKWQNYDGSFNEAGKERYFGTGKFKPVTKEEHEDKTNSKVNEIYKNYKPNDYNRALNQSNLSNEEWWKIKKELNKKLYTEDKKYSKIVNDENVKNALQEYLNIIDDTHKEEQRIYSEEFRKSNPKAENFDGDGTEFWYEFANKDIVDKGDKAYWNLREAVSKNSYKNGKWDHEILDKVMSDINEIVEKEQDSNKIYNALKENTGADFRNNDQKIGSTYSPNGNWHNPTQEEYDKIANEMKEYGWTVKRNTSDSFNPIHCYKPIKNEEYKEKDYEINDLPFHSKDSKTINKIAEDDLKFLNTKGSLNKVMNNFIDYEWKYYQDYAKENEYKPMSKTEFAKMAKQNVIFDSVGLNSGNAMSMMFDTNYDNKYDEDDQHNYFKQVYDVFQINVDPKTGNISNFYIV